jgi:FixJ family two-component response regulator
MRSVARALAPANNGQESENSPLCQQIQISIVDDDRFVREAMARLLKSHGFLAETFESAAALLGSDWRARTHCLIADVQMPEMTGLELHSQLLAAGEPIPTILITAHPDESSRVRALRAGVLCYLAKPFSEDDLLSCVRRAVER